MDSVGILEGWDRKREVAREWSHCTVYIFDSNAFVNAFVTGSPMRRVLSRRMVYRRTWTLDDVLKVGSRS